MNHGTCGSALTGITVIHTPLNDDIFFFFYKGISPFFRIINTEVGREHVDAGHWCREHAGAAVVGATDVKHGMGEDNHLVRKWVFVRWRVGIEGYHGFYNRGIYYVIVFT